MSDVELDYAFLMDDALRRVLHDVLSITQDIGAAPGEHHFYIEFLTQAPGVSIPADLLETYPERMTIVLQHQFKDLEVEDDKFAVTLWFKGEPSRLHVPFSAVATFADPGAQFELRFATTDSPPDDVTGANTDEPVEEKPDVEDASAADGSADVVSLDAFRKK
ncbi:MAG: ClpXP protease specificity-enhancing factor SspB [Pseudomonadota bacterium]